MKFFLTLIGLILVLEGLPYAACPEKMQVWLQQLVAAPPKDLRLLGWCALLAGFALCYLTQRTTVLP